MRPGRLWRLLRCPVHPRPAGAIRGCDANIQSELWRDKLTAVLTSEMCEKACGKLPTRRLATGSYSSESKPTSFPQVLEQTDRRAGVVLVAARSAQVIREPERARQECAFASREAVDVAGALGVVAEHEAVMGEAAWFDRLLGADDAWIVRRQKAHEWDHQDAGVERFGAVVLGEGVALCIKANQENLLLDSVRVAAFQRSTVARPCSRTVRRL